MILQRYPFWNPQAIIEDVMRRWSWACSTLLVAVVPLGHWQVLAASVCWRVLGLGSWHLWFALPVSFQVQHLRTWNVVLERAAGVKLGSFCEVCDFREDAPDTFDCCEIIGAIPPTQIHIF